MLFKNLLFLEFLSFRDEGIQTILLLLATDSAAGLQVLIVFVLCYRGNVVNPLWADVDTGETSHKSFWRSSPSRFLRTKENNAIASSSRSTTINDTINLSATCSLPANYANDHNQLLQCFQDCCIATIRKPDCVHSYELRLIILH